MIISQGLNMCMC